MKLIKSMDREIIKTYFGFFLHGFLVLSIGAIMPDLMRNLNLNFSTAGFLLSMFAFGNLLSNFIFPFVAEKISISRATKLFVILVPLGFLSIFVFQAVIVNFLSAIFFMIGLGIGSVNIISNIVINDLSEDKTVAINILHMTFAVGAFLSPFVIVTLKNFGLSFNQVILFIFFAMTIMWLLFSTIDFNYTVTTSKGEVIKDRNIDLYFISVAFILFFYLGVENTINGWLMTYLQSMDILSETFSATLVSLTWLMIMVGRIFTASISKKIKGTKLVMLYAIGVALMVFVLIITRNPIIITITILSLGFFMAGIYPTSISNTSDYVKGSPKRLSILFTSAAIGGMVTPQIVGWVADKTSILFAMNVLLFNVVAMIIFAYITNKTGKKQS